MTIIIWDNGQDYEEHEIDFIDLGAVPEAMAVELLSLFDRGGRILGYTEAIRWVNQEHTWPSGGSCRSVAEHLEGEWIGEWTDIPDTFSAEAIVFLLDQVYPEREGEHCFATESRERLQRRQKAIADGDCPRCCGVGVWSDRECYSCGGDGR
jgi:hypothetical protein